MVVSAPNDGGPAFPPQVVKDADGQFHEVAVYGMQSGMTLRDYFAARAMQAMWSDSINMGKAAAQTRQKLDEMIARTAYLQADAMLKARSS